MKSTRNPLSKQPRAVRRVISDVQRSDENASAASDVDLNHEHEHDELSEESPAHYCEETPAVRSETLVSRTNTEVGGDQSIDVPTPCESSISSFQLEFLKMLSHKKHTGMLGHRRKQQKIGSKSHKVCGHHTTLPHKPAAKYDGSSSSSCSQTISEQTITHEQDADDGGVKHAVGSSTSCAETSSFTCDNGTVSPVVHLNSGLVSSDKRKSQVEFTAPDDPVPAAKLSCTAVTSASRDGVTRQSSSLEQSCSLAESDILPPVLSLPAPLTDCVIFPRRPPVLEPSCAALDDRSSATEPTVSDAVSADISVTSFECEQTHVVEMSESGKQRGAHSMETDCTDVNVAASSSVSTVVCSASDPLTVTTSSDITPSLTVSTSAVAASAASAQLQCLVNTTSTAVSQPASAACRISSLAKFRPTISVNSLLPLSNCYSKFTQPGARPTVPMTPHQQPRDRI